MSSWGNDVTVYMVVANDFMHHGLHCSSRALRESSRHRGHLRTFSLVWRVEFNWLFRDMIGIFSGCQKRNHGSFAVSGLFLGRSFVCQHTVQHVVERQQFITSKHKSVVKGALSGTHGTGPLNAGYGGFGSPRGALIYGSPLYMASVGFGVWVSIPA